MPRHPFTSVDDVREAERSPKRAGTGGLSGEGRTKQRRKLAVRTSFAEYDASYPTPAALKERFQGIMRAVLLNLKKLFYSCDTRMGSLRGKGFLDKADLQTLLRDKPEPWLEKLVLALLDAEGCLEGE